MSEDLLVRLKSRLDYLGRLYVRNTLLERLLEAAKAASAAYGWGGRATEQLDEAMQELAAVLAEIGESCDSD